MMPLAGCGISDAFGAFFAAISRGGVAVVCPDEPAKLTSAEIDDAVAASKQYPVVGKLLIDRSKDVDKARACKAAGSGK